MDAVEGVFFGMLAALIFVLLFALGSAYTKAGITGACNSVGAFEYHGAVYDCKRRVVGN